MTNSERADRAQVALDAFAGDDDVTGNIGDLITDLLHLRVRESDETDEDDAEAIAERVLSTALMNFNAEREEGE